MADQHADWWATWWERDYSWEGLGAVNLTDGKPVHPWEGWIVLANGTLAEDPEPQRYDVFKSNKNLIQSGARLATLQDYWRDQENDLIVDPTSVDETGKPTRHFTRFHLPLNWQDGRSTGKAAWDEDVLNQILVAKIAESSETEFDESGSVDGLHRRVQFQGGVFLNFNVSDFQAAPTKPDAEPERIALNWRSDFACFSGCAKFNSVTFSGNAEFNSATFSRVAQFNRATFSGGAMFNSATFSDGAEFESATFSEDAYFESATFSEDAWFNSAIFFRYVSFDSATILSNAGFENVTFSGFARFESSIFFGGAWFKRATFSDGAEFESATFSGGADFVSATFSEDTWFNSASFSGAAVFTSVIFAGDVSFKGDRVSDNAAIARRAFKWTDFTDAVFLGAVDFNNRDFTEATSFKRAQFFRTVSFHGGRLHQGVSFHDARFEDALHRDRQCKISKTGLLKWWTQRDGREWPPLKAKITDRLWQAYMQVQATRNDYTLIKSAWLEEFEGERARNAQAFAELPKVRHDTRENLGWFVRMRQKFVNFIQRRKHIPEEVEGATQDDYFEDLESCFRTLKLAMEDKRDRIKEGEFFRLELKARRRRRKPGVHFWERIISDLYGMTSQYGNSAVLPVYWIAGSLFVFGLIYALQGSSSLIAWDWNWPSLADLGQAMSYSAGRIFGFGPWNAAPEACTPMANLLNLKDSDGQCGWGYWTAFGIKAQATLQTLSAIILVFLSGLAVRRRFQIN